MKITFIGSKKFGLNTLKLIENISPGLIKMIITLDDSNDSRSVLDCFVNHSKSYNIDLLFSSSKNMTHEIIKDHPPELCFVNGWYQIISEQTLKIPKYGFIGIHNSPLPKYRGGSPLVWQIINNEVNLGSSIFHLDSGMDTGNIISQSLITNDKLYIEEARSLLEKKILVNLEEVWPEIIQGNIRGSIQDHKFATYCSQLTPEDGAIRWYDCAENILAKIRAMSFPYPCAYSICNDKKIKIVRARLHKQKFYGLPGQLVSFESSTNNPIITCSPGEAIVIEKVLSDENEIVPSYDLLSSLRIRLS